MVVQDIGARAVEAEKRNNKLADRGEHMRRFPSNPERALYNAQAQQRLGSKRSQHTAGNMNSQIRNQRIVDDTADHRKER